MSNINKNIKIFFIDLDGTLLDTKKNNIHGISKKNLEAIEKAKEDGKKIIISTGRSGVRAKKYLDMFDHDYAVTGNGAIVVKNGKPIRTINMSIRQTLLIIDFVKKHNLVIKFDDMRTAYGAFSWLQSYTTQKQGFLPVKHFNVEMHKEYHKVVIWGKSKSKIAHYARMLSEEVEDVSIVTSGNGWTIEVSHKDATKGKGNLYVAELLGIKNKKEMAHIGDSMNDSTAAEYMNLIAMKNSDKELLKVAKYVGPHYKKSGVARILNGEYQEINK